MSKGISTEYIDLEVGKWITLPSNAINIVIESSNAAVIKTAHTVTSVIHTVGTVSGNSLVITDSHFLMQKVKADAHAAKIYFGRSR